MEEIGPKTIAAVAQHDADTLIKQIADERLAFLQGLECMANFRRGWTARVQRVRDAALAMVRSPGSSWRRFPVDKSTPRDDDTRRPETGDTTTTPSVQKPGDTTIKADQVAQAVLSIITALIQQGGAGQVSSGTLANILQTLGSFLKQQQQGSGDDLLAAIKQLTDQLQKTGGVVKPPPANDVTAVLQQVANVLQNVNIAPKATAPGADQQQQAAQLQQVFDFVAEHHST